MLLALFLVLTSWVQAAEINVWHAYRGAERAALERAVDDWNSAHPADPVLPLAIPYDAYNTRLEAAIPRGNGPDLFIASTERVHAWQRAGILQPASLDTSQYLPATHAALKIEGEHYGWPLAFKCLALYFNPELIDAAPETAEELLEAAQRLGTEERWGIAWEATSAYHAAPWLHGFGGGVVEGENIVLDSPENAEALRYIAALADVGPKDPTGSLISQLFNEGRVAMVINGPWFAGDLREVNAEVAALPIINATGESAAPYVTVEALFLAQGASQPDKAAAFARYLANDRAIDRAVNGRQPVAAQVAWEHPDVIADPLLAAFRTQVDTAKAMPAHAEFDQSWEPLARALRKTLRGATTPEGALTEAQTAFEILTRPPPPPANPTFYVLLASLLVLTSCVVVWRWTRRQDFTGWGFAYRWIAPTMIGLGVLVVLPFVVGSAMSLFSHRDGEWTFIGLAHFFDILFARDWPAGHPLSFYFTLVVTVAWTAINVALHVAIGMGLAMILREPWVRLRGFWRVLLILPWAVPSYITALVWKGLFHRQMGAINSLLEWFGLEPVGWFDSFLTAFAANLSTNTWLGFPFMMVVVLGALQSIPRDLEEAAALDGASAWQRFRHVTFPMVLPVLTPAIVLGSVWTFNQFNIIYLVSAGEPDGSTEILVTEAYRWAFTRGHRYGYAAAYALLIFGTLIAYGTATARLTQGKSKS